MLALFQSRWLLHAKKLTFGKTSLTPEAKIEWLDRDSPTPKPRTANIVTT